jgi:phosphonoacetaldehyde hydrolase
MRIIKAVLFDVVGTTVLESDPELINNCFQSAFLQNSITVAKSDILRVRGKDKREAIENILTSANNAISLTDQILEDFKKNVTAQIANFKEHPEFAGVMRHLRNHKIKVGIGSGLPSAVFDILYEHLNWRTYNFDFVGVFENFKVGRPDPVMILRMCENERLMPGEILKVGDTVSDVLEGKNAKAPTAIILSGTQSEELLLQSKPDHILKSLADVISIIL